MLKAGKFMIRSVFRSNATPRLDALTHQNHAFQTSAKVSNERWSGRGLLLAVLLLLLGLRGLVRLVITDDSLERAETECRTFFATNY
jgi:hypothetical protein